ncbi:MULTISPECIES: glycoside hydrolase family 3 C-terminal domain-containing protein [Micrococcaceae]|uniref:glycoside hydrolase family 3 C-terminal domain-containing protein n=1 Tax=Micrococcaceae TaxID=1268 RepID=UPI001A97E74C|nr:MULTISPECIES: glycoside hydrolase family 3 C-terminal domain-containing protein [Micrococcaceae]QSZ51252.1 glycosyl hydrolase [Arthrobacter sp. D5-1]QSZ55676.1 glycosyl hydrolase [Paenarthrobacter ureafaciens]
MHASVPKLTLDEKAALVSGASFWRTQAVPHAGVAAATLTDGPHGVRMQRASADHLGINDSEPATSFPTAAATGSTWDPALVEEMGRALGAEALALGVDVLLGPGINMKRSPLCGRNFEYFSEDPVLSGALGTAWVSGIQSKGVGASLKHFAANNQETDRMRIDVQVDERSLREIYLPAFEQTVREASPATVMCSYNKVNGVRMSENRWLLTDVLRGEWGFDGYAVSDWGAVTDPVAAIEAGLDLEMPSTGGLSAAKIAAAVTAGRLDEAVLDKAVSRILTVHDRLRASRGQVKPVDHAAHHELARRLSIAGSVLLANEGNLLPLDPRVGGKIAVIGEFARTPRYQGGGSSHMNPVRLDDALTALQERTTREVVFAAGFSFDGSNETSLAEEAVTVAADAAAVVLFLGLPAAAESEGFDRTHLQLPESQLRLAASVLAVNPNVVVVLSNGGVVTLEGIAGRTPAILEMWLGGQASGSAAADILLGIAEPGGRLAETIPHTLAHTPAHLNWPGSHGSVRYGEGVYIGYRWYDATDRDVAFPFGFGLSYTTFALTDLTVTVPDQSRAYAECAVTIENTGDRPGSEVVQIYVTDEMSSIDRPKQELKGFAKVHLAPGERRTIRIVLDERAFAFWGPNGWTVEPGSFQVLAGTSSRHLPVQRTVRLDVPVPGAVLTPESTIAEWLAHPAGHAVLQPMLSKMGPTAAAIDDEEMRHLVGSMPLRALFSLAATPGSDPDAVVLDLIGQANDRTQQALATH